VGRGSRHLRHFRFRPESLKPKVQFDAGTAGAVRVRKRNAQRFLPSPSPREIPLSCAPANVPALALSVRQYQALRSVSDHHVFVVCRDGTFYELVPEEVRKRGPWQVMRRGEIEALKPEYRLALARDGYALVKCELAVFKPEA
jgi:hypothetical protein